MRRARQDTVRLPGSRSHCGSYAPARESPVRGIEQRYTPRCGIRGFCGGGCGGDAGERWGMIRGSRCCTTGSRRSGGFTTGGFVSRGFAPGIGSGVTSGARSGVTDRCGGSACFTRSLSRFGTGMGTRPCLPRSVARLPRSSCPKITRAFGGRRRIAVAQSVGAGCRPAGTPSIQMRHIPGGGDSPGGRTACPVSRAWAPSGATRMSMRAMERRTMRSPVLLVRATGPLPLHGRCHLLLPRACLYRLM